MTRTYTPFRTLAATIVAGHYNPLRLHGRDATHTQFMCHALDHAARAELVTLDEADDARELVEQHIRHLHRGAVDAGHCYTVHPPKTLLEALEQAYGWEVFEALPGATPWHKVATYVAGWVAAGLEDEAFNNGELCE